ncbi:MAG: autotransporter outer membrane beta-barrel domain-containing protein [Rhodocyclaceae bacterium]|nr:autotransporter outer membrane beta-barrel domain-containing protein [Rhodocyclaceae bacterium]
MKTALKISLAAVACLTSSAAFATSCASVLSSYASGSVPNEPQYHPECFGASPQTSTVSINQTAFTQISAISTALANRFLAAPPTRVAGLNAGTAAAAPGKLWNVWGNLTDGRTRQEYFRPLTGNNIRISTDSLTTVIGGDYAISSMLVAGVSASFDRASGESYAGGVKSVDLLNKGYIIAPYVGMSISKELALDASIGLGVGELSQTDNVTAEADRWFLGVNLNYSSWLGNTQLSGRLGWLHGEEKYDNAKNNGAIFNNTGARNRIDQLRLGGQAAWWMNGVMPYVGLAYVYEDRRTTLAGAKDPIGKDGWQWTLGANFLSVGAGVTGGIAYTEEEGRSNQRNRVLSANIGLRF